MIQKNVPVLWNHRLSSDCFRVGLECREAFSDARPGQFVSLFLSERYDPLLRRPFSIHRLVYENNRENDPKKGPVTGIELLYKVIGKCTERLSGLKPGDSVNLLGPLGNGFTVPEGKGRVLMIAGGIGIAPMVFLADALAASMPAAPDISLLFGGRTKEDLVCLDAFASLGIPVQTATDDGSAGHKGLVTDLLEVENIGEVPALICSCGPLPMLKAVATIAGRKNIPCQVSVETLMACGIGVCLGCTAKRKGMDDKYLHACIDGPVLDTVVVDLDSI